MQFFHLAIGETIRGAKRMEPGAEEGLVDIDVPETGDKRLVEENRLETTGSALEPVGKDTGSKTTAERFRTEAAVECVNRLRLDVKDPSEFSLIGKPEIGPVVEFNCQVLETYRRGVTLVMSQAPSHPQVNKQRGAVVKIGDEILGTAPESRDLPAAQAGKNSVWIVRAQYAGERPDLQTSNGPSDYVRFQTEANCFDLGEFWHTGDPAIGGGLDR